MRTLFIFVLAPLLALPAWAQERTRNTALLDRVVAVVNNEVLTKVDLDEQLKIVTQQLSRQGTPLPAVEVLERQLLERMITARVLVQAARETGVRVEDMQLQRAIERIGQENSLTPEQLRQAMEQDGISFMRFREEVRNEILIARLKEREVDSRIAISDAEIDAYLRNQQVQGGQDDEYSLAHILVTVPEQATPEQIQARREVAERALSQLAQGTDFRQVSASFSDAQNALEGGLLGWRTVSRLPEIFVDAVRQMRVGDVSPAIRSPNGFHILKLVDKRGNQSPVIVQQARTRHILVRLSEIVSESDAKQRLESLKERVEMGETEFAELARLHSEDASGARGGDLGWLSPGDTVPEFERAMNALEPGLISEPVRTPFGWHLIEVLERRDEDMSKERQRLLAREAIRQRKGDEAYQEWVRLQRDRAYVEYRLEER